MNGRSVMVAGLVVALAACGGKGKEVASSADSLNRDLTLPQKPETVVVYRDTAMTSSGAKPAAPSPAAPKPKPQPQPAAPQPAPTPAPPAQAAAGPTPAPMPVIRTVAVGAVIYAKTDAEVTSRTQKAGDAVSATVSEAVTDASGHVVIPAGSRIALTIAEIKPAQGDAPGELVLRPVRVTINGEGHEISGTVSAATSKKGRGIGGAEIAKTGGGAAAGAILGGLIGKGTGALIGGVVGGAAGAGVAAATAKKDLVIPAGSPIAITLASEVSVEEKP